MRLLLLCITDSPDVGLHCVMYINTNGGLWSLVLRGGHKDLDVQSSFLTAWCCRFVQWLIYIYTSTPPVACGCRCWEEAKKIWTFRSSLLTAWCCTINSARATTRWPSHHKMESSGSASATSSPSWQTRWADEENDAYFAWKQCQSGQESYAKYWNVDMTFVYYG